METDIIDWRFFRDNVEQRIHNGQNHYCYELTKKLDSKANIRQLKTYLNYFAQQEIQSQLERENAGLNDNEKRAFTTRRYMENYDKVNEELSELLIDCVTWYEENK